MFKRILASIASVLLAIPIAAAQDNYKLGPDSMEQPDVPKGEVSMFKWDRSKIFPGTTRDYWVYVPKQYDGKTPAAVMVFQDGGGYQSPKGQYRATIVMDNLIHKKEIPVMIGIFINPGVFPDKDKKKGGSNRSFEYDSLTPQYVEFLEKEILPEVGKKYKLRQDGAGRGIGGASSGGICAFTAAWQRPDLFSKVLSHVGSFTNIRGGDVYPGIIRKTEKKNIRVFLQDGSNDLDNQAGNWFLANQQMEAALKFKKYEYKAVWGDGGHNGKQGGALLPESMRWLWTNGPVTSGVVIAKSEPQPPAKPKTETPPAKPKTDTPPAKLKTESPSPTPAPPATEQGAIVEPEIYVRPRRGIFGRLRLFR